jgi:hypothetical protein
MLNMLAKLARATGVGDLAWDMITEYLVVNGRETTLIEILVHNVSREEKGCVI